MAQDKKATGVLDNVRDAVGKNPAAEKLFGEVETFVRDRALDLVDSLGDRIGGAADKLEDIAANGGTLTRAGKSMSDGDGPLKAGVKAIGGGLKDRIGDLVGGGGGGGQGGKATVIAESIEIGVPVSVAYNQWTQFQEFGQFTKGVQSVEQEDETTTNWKAKVAFSTRSWNANITEQVPDERIAWTSDGDKGSVNGVVTFHELAPNLTKVLMELEYHLKGFVEKTGNLWRAQGRRARLDLKKFRQFVMMRGEETGAWRGEIRDGEVRQSSKEGERSGRRGRGERTDGRQRRRRSAEDGGRGRSGRDRRSREEMRRERRRARATSDGRDRKAARSGSSDGESEGGDSGRGGQRRRRTATSRKRTSPAKKSASSGGS